MISPGTTRSCSRLSRGGRDRGGNAVLLKPSEVAPSDDALLGASAPEVSRSRRRGGRRGRRGRDHRAARSSGSITSSTRATAGRAHRDGGGSQAPHAGDAGARRQEPVHRRRAARPRGRRAPDRLGQVLQLRPDLRRARLRAGARDGARRVRGAAATTVEVLRRQPAAEPGLWPHRQRAPSPPADGALARQRRRGLGGEATRRSLHAPIVLRNVPADAPAMRDEIFGPILPVLAVRDLEEAIAFINARPKPLALYRLLERRAEPGQRAGRDTSSGGVVINHVVCTSRCPACPSAASARAAWATITASLRSIPSATEGGAQEINGDGSKPHVPALHSVQRELAQAPM